jgi:hypothetical protein
MSRKDVARAAALNQSFSALMNFLYAAYAIFMGAVVPSRY